MLTLPRFTLSLPRLRVPGWVARILARGTRTNRGLANPPSETAGRKRRAQRLHAGELRAMSDLELKDLGIGRSEIGYLLDQDARQH